ncbi:uncharacterized protein [Solanum lycopersicum]|uniref:uncharacterized protein n=1 Tax=Solanum lycopersicum TaxID=4081 RepID=UPI000532E7D1|nr:uncharacterized protein LOC104647075 [Solanum lycopersicum]
MNCFVMGVSDDLVEEYCLVMLHDNMDISYLRMHSQQVEESRLKRKIRDTRKTKSYERGTSKGRLEVQDKPNFKKSFFNQVPSNFTKARNYCVSNPRPQRGRGGDSPSEKSTSIKCDRKHVGQCLVGKDNFFCCGKSGHKVRDCTMVKSKVKGNIQAQASGPSSDASKNNRFYALLSRGN